MPLPAAGAVVAGAVAAWPYIQAAIGAGAALWGGIKMMMGKGKKNKKKGKKGRYKPDAEDIKMINTLSKDEQQIINNMMPYFNEHGTEFLEKLPEIETARLEQIAQQPSQAPQINAPMGPDAQQLGFPPVQDVTGDIRRETDFAPIEQQTMRQFQEQILPGIKEQFAGMGGLKSSGFQGAAQAGGERLAESLAALRSKFGLERGSVLGQLGIKQGALEQQRAQAAGALGSERYQLGQQDYQLGKGAQAQQFGQNLNLAQLALAQQGHELQRRQLGLGAQANILNRGAMTPVIPQTPEQNLMAPQMFTMGMKHLGKGLGNVDFSKLVGAKSG